MERRDKKKTRTLFSLSPPEKVDEDRVDRPPHRPERRIHVLFHLLVLRGDGRQVQADRDDGVQDQGHFAVFVDKGQGVGDVVIAEVDDGGADPRPEGGLRGLQELGHGAADARGGLDLLLFFLRGKKERVGDRKR